MNSEHIHAVFFIKQRLDRGTAAHLALQSIKARLNVASISVARGSSLNSSVGFDDIALFQFRPQFGDRRTLGNLHELY